MILFIDGVPLEELIEQVIDGTNKSGNHWRRLRVAVIPISFDICYNNKIGLESRYVNKYNDSAHYRRE